MNPTRLQNLTIPQSIQLSEHDTVLIRLLEPADAPRLVAYFDGLSTTTKRYFGPHPFDPATVDTLCASLNPNECIRLIATSSDNQTIIAYTLLQAGATPADVARYRTLGIEINPDTDSSLAPSIADAYQSRGLGDHLMTKMRLIAEAMNKKRILLWGVFRHGMSEPFAITENMALQNQGVLTTITAQTTI